MRVRAIRRFAAVLGASAIALVLAGCDAGFAPIGAPGATDPGMMGCQVAPAPGATVREGNPLAPGEPLAGVPVTTMTPRLVGEMARARGLKVTWRYELTAADDTISGFSECWCEPPPGGRVTGVAYGMAAELVVFVDGGVVTGPRSQPPRGWGCR